MDVSLLSIGLETYAVRHTVFFHNKTFASERVVRKDRGDTALGKSPRAGGACLAETRERNECCGRLAHSTAARKQIHPQCPRVIGIGYNTVGFGGCAGTV